MSTARGTLDSDLVWGHHLLVVGDGVAPQDLEALTLSRFPGASRRDEHTLDLLPGAWLTGPWTIDDTARERLGLPAEASTAYLARSPVDRAGPVPEELRGIGGLLDAFADGTPEGIEGEVVQFLHAVARRLGGGLRVGGSGSLVVPDPDQLVDLIVYSPIWLEPDALQVVLEPVLAGIDVLPRVPQVVLPQAPEPDGELSSDRHRELHSRAEAFDAAALTAPTVLEGYGALWRFPDDGVISVHVEEVDVVPLALREVGWADRGLLSYAVRWYPAEDDDPGGPDERGERGDSGEPDEPDEPEPTTPGQARATVEAAAAALHAAAGGSIADDDGFLVEL